MEKFRKKIQARIIWMGLVAVLIAVSNFALLLNAENLPKLSDFNRGFQSGIFGSIEVILILTVIKNIVSIRDENKLKKLYIKEHDERTKMIMQKTGAIGMAICMVGLAFATVIAGFFNQLVFFSLLGATLFTSLVKGFLKLYYSRKL